MFHSCITKKICCAWEELVVLKSLLYFELHQPPSLTTMRNQFVLCFLVFSIISACTPENKTPMESDTDPSLDESTVYTGPIIDMHIHAYEQSIMFGMPHPPSLRGETNEGVASAEELREQTFQKFRDHRIVKAVITNGDSWVQEADVDILLAKSNRTVDELRDMHASGKMDVLNFSFSLNNRYTFWSGIIGGTFLMLS